VAKDASNAERMHVAFVDLATTARVELVSLMRPTPAIFQQQTSLVANYAELRGDRQAEVLTQMPSQNEFWGGVIGLSGERHKWTLQLAALLMTLVNAVEMRLKHAFACPRPVEQSPQVQPLIPTPGHASWPSGHATEIYATVELLKMLLPARLMTPLMQAQLDRLAARVAVNRTVAGVHYPVDSAAGRLLGTALGRFFAARCGSAVTPTATDAQATVDHWGFDGPAFVGPGGAMLDFDPRVSLVNGAPYYRHTASATAIAFSPMLHLVWSKTLEEWA
ncbi:MAG: phosphatase PAP2 family protein, partial [Ottowia sp.]|nr:phosphatase PAP2 family protein [Ottowia sp.]